MKVSVIGAGNVGGVTAMLLMQHSVEEIVLVDIAKGRAAGKAIDLAEATPLAGSSSKVTGSGDIAAIAGSDVVIVTAGMTRKPGMTRMDLLNANKVVVEGISTGIKKNAPDSIAIIVTNPLDLMAYVAMKATGFPRERVFGMAGTLDSSRLSYFASEKLGKSPASANAVVLGSHGNAMVPLLGHSTFDGKPLDKILPKKELLEIVERTRNAGAEIVELLANGSAFFAPAYGIVGMLKAIAEDSKQVMPCSAFLQGEYGFHGVFLGVPCRLGRKGIEEIIELPLSRQERQMLSVAAEEIRQGMLEMENETKK